MTALDHILAFVVGLLLPVLQAWPRSSDGEEAEQAQPQTSQEKRNAYWGTAVVHTIFGGLTLLVWRAGDRTFHDLGLTAAPTNAGVAFALTALYFVLYGADTLEKLRPSRLAHNRERCRREAPHMPATWGEVAHSIPAATAGAVWEEVVFRGFLIAYVASFTGTTAWGLAAAIVLPAVAFGVLHLNQGGRAALLVLVLAVIVGVILVVTGSLWIPIAIHAVVNLIGMLLGPWLMRDSPSHTPR